MSEQSRFMGKKFSCPGCHVSLKFRRPPTKQLLVCPTCRRKFRLQEERAAVNHDELLKDAIDLLLESKQPEKPYDYARDPKLDLVDDSDQGIWIFDQPWPPNSQEIVFQKAEVIFSRLDKQRAMRARKKFLSGKYKRVTVFRTGQVEQMEVTGHWFEIGPRDEKLGLLARSTVRILNRFPLVKNFVARLHSIERQIVDHEECFRVFIDLAIGPNPTKRKKIGADFK